MEFLISGSPRNIKWCEALLPSMIDQLGLTNSRKSLLVVIRDMERNNHSGAITSGTTQQIIGTEIYLLVIKPVRDLTAMGLTLAHEMVHVRQMTRGTLKFIARGAKLWAGKRYAKNTPYLDQPWEQDAFARTELLFRRALEA